MIDNESENNKVNEPDVNYEMKQLKRIHFFKSFEEAEEFNIRDQLSKSPEQRMANFVIHLENIFFDELKNAKLITRIHFLIQ